MHIHTATLDDIDSIRSVGIAAWHDTYAPMLPAGYIEWALAKWWSREALERYIVSDSFHVLVAEVDQCTVGMAHIQIRPDATAMLWRLYVAQAYRGQGIGTRLLAQAQQQLPPEVQWLFVEYYQQNERAGRFYAAHGFTFDHLETAIFQTTPIVSVFVKRPVHHLEDKHG